jgi:hypothetical protein
MQVTINGDGKTSHGMIFFRHPYLVTISSSPVLVTGV